MTMEIIKKKPFLYVDFMTFGDHDVSPLCTGYSDDAVRFEAEIDEDDGLCRDAWSVLAQPLNAVQLCGEDGEEIFLSGNEIYEYINPEMEVYLRGEYRNVSILVPA